VHRYLTLTGPEGLERLLPMLAERGFTPAE